MQIYGPAHVHGPQAVSAPHTTRATHSTSQVESPTQSGRSVLALGQQVPAVLIASTHFPEMPLIGVAP